MSTNLMILDLLERSRITFEEALHLLTALRQSQSPNSLLGKKQAILIKFLSGRSENV